MIKNNSTNLKRLDKLNKISIKINSHINEVKKSVEFFKKDNSNYANHFLKLVHKELDNFNKELKKLN